MQENREKVLEKVTIKEVVYPTYLLDTTCTHPDLARQISIQIELCTNSFTFCNDVLQPI